MEGKREPFVQMKAARADRYFPVFTSGRADQIYSGRLGGKAKRIGVELCLLRDPDRHAFAKLKQINATIEAAVGKPFEWSDKPGVPRCHFIRWQNNSDIAQRERWQEFHEWQWDRLLALRSATLPALE